jgi:hypothetical protein
VVTYSLDASDLLRFLGFDVKPAAEDIAIEFLPAKIKA